MSKTPTEARSSHVLVIDDDRDIRVIVELILRYEGIPVETAENGRAALAQMKSGPLPSLILLDLMMPEMDGWAFCEAIRADERLRPIPIVVMTAFDDTSRPIPTASGILRKPLSFESLKDSLRKYCAPTA